MHNLLFLIPFLFYPAAKGLIIFLQIMIHFWIGFCEYLNIVEGPIFLKLEELVHRTRDRKNQLMVLRCQIELILPVYFIFQNLIFGLEVTKTVILIIIFVNYLRIKYLLNENIKIAAYRINESLENSVGDSKIMLFLLKYF